MFVSLKGGDFRLFAYEPKDVAGGEDVAAIRLDVFPVTLSGDEEHGEVFADSRSGEAFAHER